ncbi:MAG: YidC/Oxa1 family membrane protein insertase [Candidatus Geothermincolales bacterium]
MQAFYKLTGNYGVAIILLTLFIRLLILPLTWRQTKSMIALQKLQPELKKIQEKYKDDKERLSQEMMKFYREHKVNPFSGCFPLLIQLPIFIALYTAIRTYLLTPPTALLGNALSLLPGGPSALVFKSSSFLWIENLADTTRIADPVFVLVILLGFTTWYSQKQVMKDPKQKNMLIIMPLFTVFIGLSLPAGVVLYWLVTNIFQIAQQYGIEWYEKKHPEEVERIAERAERKAAGKKAGESPAKRAEKAPERAETSKGGAGKTSSRKGAKGKAAAGKKQQEAGKRVRKPRTPPPKTTGGKAG